MLDKEAEQGLLEIFGERVAFHATERRLYSKDTGCLPMSAGKLKTVPDAVVQPTSTEELQKLMDLAVKFNVPLVPRGSGTAGFGGAVPVRGGIVIDFYRLSRVLEINTEEKTVTMESGTVWNDLEKQLRERSLALRTYPGSAISATVGGWLANGVGIGIGSFEFGQLRDNVVSVDLMTPQGLRHITGDELSLVDGMAGTTGLVSCVKLKVREADEDIPVLAAFNDLDTLLGAFQQIQRRKLPLWHAGFRDPLHVRLNRDAMRKQAGRTFHNAVDEEPAVPEQKLLVLFVYPERRHGLVADSLLNVIKEAGGDVLSEEAARHEWEERFYPMRLKALGPSVTTTEATIQTEKLPELISAVGGRGVVAPFDGVLLDGGERTMARTYVLDHEYLATSVSAREKGMITVGETRRLGGRAYFPGMYLDHPDVSPLVRAFKEQVDPAGIVNPGKIFPAPPEEHVSGDMDAGEAPPGKDPFGDELVHDAYACDACGYCRTVCPVFDATGWESASPRGKFRFIREYLEGRAKLDERMAEMFFVCTTCQKCDRVCQAGLPVEDDFTLKARPVLLREGFHPPLIFQRQAHNILTTRNPGGFPQDKRTAWVSSDLKYRDAGEVGYWAGCAASFTYLLRNLPINAVRVLNKAGIEPVYLGSEEWCCGGAAFNLGCLDDIMAIVEHNINELNNRGVKTLITSCSGCWMYLSRYYPLLARKLGLQYNIKVRHITEVVDDLIAAGNIECKKPVELKVTYHDPCHIGRGGGIFEQPRHILASVPGLELVEMPRNRENSACCGKHAVRYARLGGAINRGRIIEAEQTGASIIVSCCPTCENNLRMGVIDAANKMDVLDIIDIVAESAGLPRLSVSRISKLLRK
jgi:Fe-S oxidoreductase/FAD/FMN-containing dehydrogenase